MQTYSKLELVVTANRSGNVVLLKNLLAVEPKLEVARVVVSPVRLDNDLVPLSSLQLAEVVKWNDVALAVVASVNTVDNAGVQLAARDPDHGAGHPVVATVVTTRAV